MLEIDADGSAAPVEHGYAARIDSALDDLGAVQANDVGAHVGEHHPGERTGADPA